MPVNQQEKEGVIVQAVVINPDYHMELQLPPQTTAREEHVQNQEDHLSGSPHWLALLPCLAPLLLIPAPWELGKEYKGGFASGSLFPQAAVPQVGSNVLMCWESVVARQFTHLILFSHRNDLKR